MVIKIRLKKPSFARYARLFRMFKNGWVRVACIGIVLALVTLELNVVLQPYLVAHTYAMGNAGTVLSQKDSFLGDKLVFDSKNQVFLFNQGYSPIQDTDTNGGGAKITAKAYQDPAKGLEVSDPINEIEFTLIPKFDLLQGKQDGNRVVYPLRNGTGWLVYTMQATGVKEDVVLDHVNGNNMDLTYDMKLDDGFVTRLQKDGSVGVFGPDATLTGHISTGNDKDAALLRNARKNAAKTKLYFSMPAPVAYTTTGDDAGISVHYEVDGTKIKTVARNLKKGHYPLTIDPSVTVTSTSDLFRDTNPESNADFDATTGSITRGKVTGGVIPAWTANTNNLATARFLHGGTIYDDYAYVAGGAGAGSTTNLTTVEFARLSTVNQTIGTWSTTTALPTGLSRFTLLAYNGYLYAIGGATSSTSCGTDSNNVYYNRIQVNGQLSGTWSTTATLPSSVCGVGAAVYNGKMYVAGGRTGSATSTGITTTAYATVNPNGSLGTFTSDDSTLPAARFDTDLRIYNGYAYIIGGNLNGTLTNTVLYAPLASDGSLYGGAGTATWKSASSFGTARSNGGSSFTATNDGYMYVQGGCSAYTSDSCTSVRNEIQTAQINADGTLGPWSDVATTIASLSRVGNTIALWRGTIYSFAGCTGMTAGVVSCVSGNTINTQSYSKISDPGQVGPVNSTTAIPTAMFAHGSVVNAGRIYVVGGCIKVSCETGTADTTGNTSYATLNADGTVGSWTTDSTNLLNGATGLAAFGMAVYNNYLYATGGYTSAGPSRNVYYVQLNASTGALTGAWTSQANKLGATTTYNSAVAYRDFLFVFGGCINNTTGSAGCNNYRNTNYRMPLAAGVPGTLTTSAATGNFLNLPTAKGLMAPALYNGYIYLAGGATGAVGQTNIIFYARIADNGNITAWLGTSSGVNGTTAKLAHNLRRADAVAMNGYLYVFGGHDGGGPTTYGDIEIGKIDMSTGDISGSTLTNSVIQITPRWDERAVFSNGYMYATGGCSVGDPPNLCSTMSTLTEYVEVFNAGNKGTSTWANNTNVYSGNVVSPATTAYNGYIYKAGGCSTYTVGTNFSNPFCTANVNTTAYATLNPDGTIGSWTPGPNLTASNSRGGGCLVQQGGYLYYIGGEDNAGNGTATILYSQIGANGVPGSWSQSTNGLPAVRSWHGCATFGDRIYATGGMDGSGAEQTSVYYSPLLATGGNITSAWSTATAFTGVRAHHSTVIIGGYLFAMGGDDGTSALFDVQSIAVDPSTGNTSGSWQYSREMPQGVSYQSVVAANGYVYLFGGRTSATACISNTYIASVNSTGRLSGWSQAVNNFTTARFGAGSAYYNGYYYLLGGNDCTNIISSNVIQYGGQQSQAMKTLISKYADFNGDGTPRSFVGYLTNAVNNSVDIEKWRMQYKSSREAANAWGVTTTVSPLTNQLKNTVFAYDGSSTDVKVVRWFVMSWDINMEQSFTFTDDTRPTISQYELYYSPPPGKRLMHGKDFRDQTQQDLEANP